MLIMTCRAVQNNRTRAGTQQCRAGQSRAGHGQAGQGRTGKKKPQQAEQWHSTGQDRQRERAKSMLAAQGQGKGIKQRKCIRKARAVGRGHECKGRLTF